MNYLTNRFKQAYENPIINCNKKSTTFHPSAASIKIEDAQGNQRVIGACLREQYYRITTDSISNPGLMDYSISADIGEKLHQLIEQYIELYGFKMGLQKIEAESIIFDEELNLSGRSDLLVWDYKNNELIGIEVKSLGEFKAGKCAESPDEQHVMQALLYLDFYNRHIPEGMPRPTKWYIWYISRTENWTIKSKKHGSPLQMLWDFHITMDSEGCPTVHTATSKERWADFSVEKIKDRYADLAFYVSEGIVPPRDFEIQYSEERIAADYKNDKIKYKGDKEKIKKWLDKGAPSGKLNLEMGDFACRFCNWKDHCWNGTELKSNDKFNIPDNKPKVEEKKSNLTSDFIL